MEAAEARGEGPVCTAEAERAAASEESRLRKQLALIESQEEGVLVPFLDPAETAAAAAAAATTTLRDASVAHRKADEAAAKNGASEDVARLVRHAAEADREAECAARRAADAAACVPIPDSARWLRLINVLESLDGPSMLRATSHTLQQMGLTPVDMALLRKGLTE